MKLPKSFHNWTSLSGSIIAIISMFMIVFLIVISSFLGEGSSYLGLVIYILLPVILIIGLLMIPLGMIFYNKKLKRTGQIQIKKWPYIDLNTTRHRNAFLIFTFGTVVFLLFSAVGSYEAFHYTESVEFCGTLCHQVMEPEYVAYQNSPHARVSCVECHVGSGANWYVRSKLSGLYQVYAVLTNNYPRPIPTPITNLRPARETCEECHWPEKFYARTLRIEKHYLADEANTEWDIALQMKIGSSYSALGLKEGIHWHINPDVRIEYMASPDSHRDTIPWVKMTNLKTGEETIFEDPDYFGLADKMEGMENRIMDCMDCHNRPSHDYQTPVRFINDAITAGRIPRELPDIKSLAMEVINNDFPTLDSAFSYIEAEVLMYYEYMHEDIFENDMPLIKKAISAIQSAFSKNIFPYMGVSWTAYPNHIGHLEFNGCFRCHNDRHVSESGKIISMDCNLCHTIIAQGAVDTLQMTDMYQSLEFVHPNDPNEAWKREACSACHKELY
ncbi:MAG: NapC/NirT family cytochrome c [Bacteroidales bacterium]|nr:NapC/NirT family cytochrome c [Bacteroidales bacterium]